MLVISYTNISTNTLKITKSNLVRSQFSLDQWFSTFFVPWPISRGHIFWWLTYIETLTSSFHWQWEKHPITWQWSQSPLQKKSHCLSNAEIGWFTTPKCSGFSKERKKDNHVSNLQVLVHITVHVNQYFSTSFGMQTNF